MRPSCRPGTVVAGWQDPLRGRTAVLHRDDGLRQEHAGAPDQPQPRGPRPGRPDLHHPRPRRRGDAVVPARDCTHDAIEVDADFDFWRYVVDALTHGARIDYLICDEAQFYQPEQIDQLARIVDDLQIDVFAFGILTDFRSELFPGSARLVELADRMHVLQVEALCWCGQRATHNARTENGEMVTEGEVIVVGDVDGGRRARRRWSATRCSAASTTDAG